MDRMYMFQNGSVIFYIFLIQNIISVDLLDILIFMLSLGYYLDYPGKKSEYMYVLVKKLWFFLPWMI